MSQSLSIRTLSDLQLEEQIINLTDSSTVLQFAQCLRNLSVTRRQSIWAQNVQIHGVVQSQTKLHPQIDDILLFLIIIYGKEQYQDQEEYLISKLKIFVASAPFIRLKQYIQNTYFPLFQHEFINNTDYFAAMIEDYAKTQLIHTLRNMNTESCSDSSHSHKSSSSSMHIDSIIYNRLEEKMMDLFAAKFGELESKINYLEKEIYSIKSINNNINESTHNVDITDDIIVEINNIKKQMTKISKNTKNMNKKNGKNENKKKRKQSSMDCEEKGQKEEFDEKI